MIGTEELLVVAVVVVVLFGGAKIPELMKGIGQGLGEFRRGMAESKSSD